MRRRSYRAAAPRALAIAALLSAAGALPAAAQSVELSLREAEGGLRASVLFHWSRTQSLLASLRDGLEARITFVIRLYESRTGLLPFPGDRLLAERVISRSAFWDFLDGSFVIESESGEHTTCSDENLLLRTFFSLSGVALPARAEAGGRLRYVTARARFEPVRLMPPLTIVALAGAGAAYTTPWVREDAP
jgi:hypothetical protein